MSHSMKRYTQKVIIEKFLEQNPDWSKYPDLITNPPTAEELQVEFKDVDPEVLRRHGEWIAALVTRGAFYFRARMQGSSDRAAAMYALQKTARIETDDVFFQGAKPLYEQFESQQALNRTLRESKKRGFTPDKNAIYYPNLARFRGDPEAYVTRAMGRSYIRKLLENRGWSAEGGVNVKGREPESDPLDAKNCKPLGEDIVRRRMSEEIKKNPDLARGKNRKELRQKIIERHGSKP
jgi:hypothetical protein